MSAPWHPEARRLRDIEGLSYRAISKRMGISDTAIHCALNEKTRERRRARQREEKRSCHEPKAVPRVKRVPLVVSPEVIKSAVLAYHEGKIDRFEMGRRMTPERPVP